MNELTTTIDTYLEGYGEADAARSAALITQAFTEDASLIDPPLDGHTHDGIVAMAQAVRSLYPGHRFRRTSAVDAHHGFARYGWQLLTPDDTVVLTGMDVVKVAADGRLEQVVGFFGDLAIAPVTTA